MCFRPGQSPTEIKTTIAAIVELVRIHEETRRGGLYSIKSLKLKGDGFAEQSATTNSLDSNCSLTVAHYTLQTIQKVNPVRYLLRAGEDDNEWTDIVEVYLVVFVDIRFFLKPICGKNRNESRNVREVYHFIQINIPK